MAKTLQHAFIEAADKLAAVAKLPTYSALVSALEHAVAAAADTAQEEGCAECKDASAMVRKIRRLDRGNHDR